MKTILAPEADLINRIDAILAPEANHSKGTTMLTKKYGNKLGIIKQDIGFNIDWKTLYKTI